MTLRARYPGEHYDDAAGDNDGAMLAWTPSVVVLAVLLRDIPELDETEEFVPHWGVIGSKLSLRGLPQSFS